MLETNRKNLIKGSKLSKSHWRDSYTYIIAIILGVTSGIIENIGLK